MWLDAIFPLVANDYNLEEGTHTFCLDRMAAARTPWIGLAVYLLGSLHSRPNLNGLITV